MLWLGFNHGVSDKVKLLSQGLGWTMGSDCGVRVRVRFSGLGLDFQG